MYDMEQSEQKLTPASLLVRTIIVIILLSLVGSYGYSKWRLHEIDTTYGMIKQEIEAEKTEVSLYRDYLKEHGTSTETKEQYFNQ